jgi:hypothetical protein
VSLREVGDPDFLHGPPSCPVGGGQLVVGVVGGIGRGVDLAQVLDGEAAGPQCRDPFPVAGMELRPALGGDQPACLPLRAQQFPPGGPGRFRTAHRGQDADRVEHQPPARPQQPGCLGDPAGRVAPQAGAALRYGQVEPAGRQRDIPASASMSGKTMRDRCWQRRAVESWAGVRSTPVGRAPRLASQAEKYAVPQPSSTTSRPATSPSTPSCCSGTLNTPHVMSSAAQARSACSSSYSRFARVHRSRLAAVSAAVSLALAILPRLSRHPMDASIQLLEEADARPITRSHWVSHPDKSQAPEPPIGALRPRNAVEQHGAHSRVICEKRAGVVASTAMRR